MMLESLRAWVDQTLAPWFTAQNIPSPRYTIEEPPAGIDADMACNIAMLLSKPLRKAPRQIAEELKKILESAGGPLQAVTIAGAGFLNFQLKPQVLVDELRSLYKESDAYGRRTQKPSEKILVEFVSANPTGPLHVGHGRGAALGDSLALILAHLGYPVTREYYINDAGNQVSLLGESLLARALELEGKPFTMPAEGYQADYMKDIAKEYVPAYPAANRTVENATQFALERLLAAIRKDLEDFGVTFDSWFSEASLVKKGAVEQHIDTLRKRGHIEEADDALWFVAPGSSETEGEEKDKNRVLKRRDGRWTYFATDIAYHADKMERGYDRLVDLWGADHHGYVARVKGSMQALGYNADQLQVLLYQLVSLTRNGVPVSMSKRSGDFIMLREVLQEVGRDACRFFFALRGPNTAFEFDLELAKKQSVDNPVYYLQYAHARICSIFRSAEEKLGTLDISQADLSLLTAKEERDLIKRLLLFPNNLDICASENSPHPLATYLLLLGRQFHHFYDHHRVLGEDEKVTRARLALLYAVRQVMRIGLRLLGVSAPEQM